MSAKTASNEGLDEAIASFERKMDKSNPEAVKVSHERRPMIIRFLTHLLTQALTDPLWVHHIYTAQIWAGYAVHHL